MTVKYQMDDRKTNLKGIEEIIREKGITGLFSNKHIYGDNDSKYVLDNGEDEEEDYDDYYPGDDKGSPPSSPKPETRERVYDEATWRVLQAATRARNGCLKILRGEVRAGNHKQIEQDRAKAIKIYNDIKNGRKYTPEEAEEEIKNLYPLSDFS